MDGFKATLLNELVKLAKKKKIVAAVILSVLVVLIGQVAVTSIKHGLGLRVVGSTEFPLVALSLITYTVLPLFATFVAIDMFNGEFTANTMKLTLLRPVSRFSVFCAKVANLALFIAANLVLVMVLSLLAGFLFNMTAFSFMGLVRVIVSYAVTFLPIFVFSLLVVCLGNVIRGGLAVFFLSVISFAALWVLGAVFSAYSSFFIISMFDWYTLWISDALNLSKILRQALILAGCGIMLFTAGFYCFDRKEI
ncbi:ABC transporter permease [Paenibacillus sp. YN15]|uniref:ABC transporter permease n=1 Tax=Paenibacillus sp. YN15 TaxID=1742774 RepID=UPI000DCC28E2|nr:ABC transporter permease [Paenibacillus sp. YN15]RAV05514.1 ABC transporter permease [Paenibacillus sp. YN15]